MCHETMASLMLININDKIWTQQEREEIIQRAVDKYLSKRQIKRVATPPTIEFPAKVLRIVVSDSGTEEDIDDGESCVDSNDSESFVDSESSENEG